MNYYNASGQMDLSDRIAIETGICIGESFKKIAKRLRRHPSTIAHEVKENRTFIKGNYPNGKDCRMARQCTVRNLCGCDEEACNTKCRLCRGVDCTKVCDRYVSVACHKFDSPPYVCNNCKDKKLCNKDKYIYSAKFADVAVTRRRSESRQGVRLSDEKKEELYELVTRLVKKEQPMEITLKPRVRTYREKSRRSAIRESAEQKQETRRKLLEQQKKETEKLRALEVDGKIYFDKLPVLEPRIREILLKWLSDAMESADFSARTDDGRRYILDRSQAGENCVVHCEDGNFTMPKLSIVFQEEV